MTKSSLFFLYQSRRIEEFTVELGRANLDIVLSLFFHKLNADFAASRGFLMELIYLGRRVPLHYMVPRFQGCILPDTTPPKRLKPNRIVVGTSLRLHWELHHEFPDVQTLWTIKTQPKCNILRANCLNLVPENAPKKSGVHIWGMHRIPFDTTRDDIVLFRCMVYKPTFTSLRKPPCTGDMSEDVPSLTNIQKDPQRL